MNNRLIVQDLSEKLLELGSSAVRKTAKVAVQSGKVVGGGVTTEAKKAITGNFTPIQSPEEWHRQQDNKKLADLQQKLSAHGSDGDTSQDQAKWSAFNRYRAEERDFHAKQAQEKEQDQKMEIAALNKKKQEQQQESQSYTPLDTGSKRKMGGRPGQVRKKAKTAETRVGQGKQ